MAELTSSEIMDIFMASRAIRESARTLDFAQLTMEDVKEEALEFIGGEAATLDGTKVGKYKKSSAPLGRLDRLAIMEGRVNQVVDAAIARGGA